MHRGSVDAPWLSESEGPVPPSPPPTAADQDDGPSQESQAELELEALLQSLDQDAQQVAGRGGREWQAGPLGQQGVGHGSSFIAVGAVLGMVVGGCLILPVAAGEGG